MAKSKLPLELTLDEIKGLEQEGKIRKETFRFERVVVYQDRIYFQSYTDKNKYLFIGETHNAVQKTV